MSVLKKLALTTLITRGAQDAKVYLNHVLTNTGWLALVTDAGR